MWGMDWRQARQKLQRPVPYLLKRRDEVKGREGGARNTGGPAF